jgi:ribosomal protein S18 acetylase RimI-like enzyme
MATRRRARPTKRPAVEVRAATEADVPALARLGAWLARWHHVLDPARFIAPEPLEPGYAWWLGKEVVNPRAVVLAAVRRGRGRGRVVGYAYGRLEARDWNTLRDACGVGVDLVVEPRARGGGVGRRLVEALSDALAARGAPRVVIDVATGNDRARRFFEALGFRPTMVEMAREAPGAPAGRRRGGARQTPVHRRASRRRRGVGT